MNAISKCYNNICTQKYQPLGFARNQSILARIRGDVLQAFTLKFYRGVSLVSVEFGVWPLCIPQPIVLEAGGYELDAFVVGQEGWKFNPNSDKSIINCINAISETIDLYLLPLFEVCSDCKAALPELIRIEELFDKNRRRGLQLIGESDSADPWQERSLFDPRKYFMALKAHNILYAKKYLNHQISFYNKSLEDFDRASSQKQPDIVRKRFVENVSMCIEQLDRLNSGEFAYFEDLVKANEERSYEFLRKKYPKIYKTGDGSLS